MRNPIALLAVLLRYSTVQLPVIALVLLLTPSYSSCDSTLVCPVFVLFIYSVLLY